MQSLRGCLKGKTSLVEARERERAWDREGADGKMSKSHLLDASAVLDFVEDGPGGKRVEPLFKDALGKRSRALMSVVNWGEVF